MNIAVILIGIFGLGIVVLIHEFGHFLAARAVGVEVEAFSIGWGPRVAGFRRKGVDWRISAFPIGGYCRMKGEEGFRKALEEKSETIPRDPGSFYGASPWKRIVIALAGPSANVLFAFLILVFLNAVGYSERSLPNRIVLASEISLGSAAAPVDQPADRAGLKTGDRILMAGGKPVTSFADLQEAIGLSPGKILPLELDREGQRMRLDVLPLLDKETGTGRIGVYYWLDTLVDSVRDGSAAFLSGIQAGDRIVAVDGKAIRNTIELEASLSNRPERVSMAWERQGSRMEASLILSWTDTGTSDLGLGFALPLRVIRAESLGGAVAAGYKETAGSFLVTLAGMGSLFTGVNPLKVIAGPTRIISLVGQTAVDGYADQGVSGLSTVLRLLVYISIGLFIMNLLPIPALDGGMILMFLVEGIRSRPLKTITVYRYQLAGSIFVFALFAMAMLSDLLFFTGN
jgi:regulator of sigma E protease